MGVARAKEPADGCGWAKRRVNKRGRDKGRVQKGWPKKGIGQAMQEKVSGFISNVVYKEKRRSEDADR